MEVYQLFDKPLPGLPEDLHGLFFFSCKSFHIVTVFSNIKRKVFGYTQFAQFGEDAVLAELFRDTSHGIYIDVGAHHPYRYSNTYLLHKKGWHGTNIDPYPYTIRLFNMARPQDKNICSGVGNAGTLMYYQFSDPAVNTFKKEEAEKWKGKSFLKFLGTTDVEVRPLSE